MNRSGRRKKDIEVGKVTVLNTEMKEHEKGVIKTMKIWTRMFDVLKNITTYPFVSITTRAILDEKNIIRTMIDMVKDSVTDVKNLSNFYSGFVPAALNLVIYRAVSHVFDIGVESVIYKTIIPKTNNMQGLPNLFFKICDIEYKKFLKELLVSTITLTVTYPLQAAMIESIKTNEIGINFYEYLRGFYNEDCSLSEMESLSDVNSVFNFSDLYQGFLYYILFHTLGFVGIRLFMYSVSKLFTCFTIKQTTGNLDNKKFLISSALLGLSSSVLLCRAPSLNYSILQTASGSLDSFKWYRGLFFPTFTILNPFISWY
eukprot:TRINITY_DN2103_c5_g1_i1.p1 TRINITY_DN2103_c5_g1~~TRINITY_DN2103_c5_g1_i1.p1  ORF type:complete len:315 (+),score=39.55 TRINITY_DN2103_c5_g1_i1:65-1009(+)